MFHRMMNYGESEARPGLMITKDLIRKHIPKYRRHDDLIIVHQSAWDDFKRAMPMPVVRNENSPFSIDEDELASLVCQTIAGKLTPCGRMALERGVKNDNYRTPDISMLLGESGLVLHKDNRITYQFDVTKCMFSFGNVREKMRMAELDCSNEIVVDLFAGIGYFSLPLLVHAHAKHLYACEWNPDAVAALKHNLTLNKVEPERYTVIEGDNRLTRPTNVAQRVMLGILPSCLDWMKTALECVDKTTGAMLHCHDLVEVRPTTATTLANNTTTTTTTSSLPKQIANAVSKQSSAESQNSDSINCGSAPRHNCIDKNRSSLDNQSLVYQSLSSSSTSSHSTLEKLSAPPSEDSRLMHSGESHSDKDNCSPVLLERPSSNSTSSFADPTAPTIANSNNNTSGSHDQLSLGSSSNQQMNSSNNEESNSILEPPLLADSETGAYEARGFALIARIKDELETHNLTARLLHIQPVKSYAPHINHVVFDIKLEPRHLAMNGAPNGNHHHEQQNQVFTFNNTQSK